MSRICTITRKVGLFCLCMCMCVLTWGWDSDRRVYPPWWLWANSNRGASQSRVGQIGQNSGERKWDKKEHLEMSDGKQKRFNFSSWLALSQVISLLVSAVWTRALSAWWRGSAAVRVWLRHWPSRPWRRGGGAWSGPVGDYKRRLGVGEGGHTRQSPGKKVKKKLNK